jgi:hypothetical protein
MLTPKAPAVLRALLGAGVPRDRANEIAQSAARLAFGGPWRPWTISPPDPRVIEKLNRATCRPLVRPEERDDT